MLTPSRVRVYVIVLAVLGVGQVGLAELVDDFSGPQTGSWAPARWWDDYACRGRLVLSGDKAPKLDIAFSRGQREKEIIAAGGFVVEVDIPEVRGSAAICIGSADFQKKGIAVVVQADNSSAKDKLYVNGQAIEISAGYEVGQKVRIEFDMKDFEKSTQGQISVYFGGVEVVCEQPFQWKKSPLGFFLAAREGRAIFDNLFLSVAQPTIEFSQSASAGTEQQSSVLVDAVLSHAEPGQKYSVDYSVSSKTAKGDGVDYGLKGGTIVFLPGESRKTISMMIADDGVKENDEVVTLKLGNVQGNVVQLGSKAAYSHTIVGEFPLVQFENPSLVVPEDGSDVHVNVVLSHPCKRQVIVGYELVDGTAKAGQDLRVPAGQLVFEPGQLSKSVTVDVIDDSDSENSINETALVQLSASNNCALGENSKLNVEIIDNEPWIEFDGSMWICGMDKHAKVKGQNVLRVNDKGQLEWAATYGDILYAKLPVKSVDEKAEYGWLYKGEGNATGSYVENICERYGSGDLRVAMLDLGDKSMSLEKQYTRNDEIFCGSRGYQARLSPHVPTDQRADKWATRVTPNGGNCHSPVDWGGCWGFETYYNGHGVPVGEFTPMIITVERTSEDTVEFSVEMNNEKHIMVDKNKYLLSQDKDKMREYFGKGAYGTGAYGTGYGPGVYEVEIAEDYQPKKIDLMAIYFANQRPYDLITFAPLK